MMHLRFLTNVAQAKTVIAFTFDLKLTRFQQRLSIGSVALFCFLRLLQGFRISLTSFVVYT